MKIIGISGHKQSGKSTLAECLALEFEDGGLSQLLPYYEVQEISFAGPIKVLVWDYFVASARYELPRECDDWDCLDRAEIKDAMHPCGKTLREILQYVGTDAFRSIWPDIWVAVYKMCCRRFGDDDNALILTPDVRFPNEVKAIQDMGGKVIRLTRTPFPEDNHESETALDKAQDWTLVIQGELSKSDYEDMWGAANEWDGPVFDWVIDNAGFSEQGKNNIALQIITERNWI